MDYGIAFVGNPSMLGWGFGGFAVEMDGRVGWRLPSAVCAWVCGFCFLLIVPTCLVANMLKLPSPVQAWDRPHQPF